ncbi:MAG: IS3 family transposase, partial [bacterium]|nr:IS3 family transposase [bacterium]
MKADHPFWGIRRVWAYLNFRKNFKVNKKRVYRLLKENNLLVKKNQNLRAKRYSNRSKPVVSYANQYWGIDMTKIMISPFGWLYLVIVIDWYSKEIIGYQIKAQSKT